MKFAEDMKVKANYYSAVDEWEKLVCWRLFTYEELYLC